MKDEQRRRIVGSRSRRDLLSCGRIKARHGTKDALPLGAMPAANTEAQLIELQPLGMMPAANTEDQQPLQTAGVLLKDKLQ